jgi:hypothetical protein
MRTTLVAACAAISFSCLHALAQPAIVEAVQYPAWIGRGKVAAPLTPGTRLEAHDQVRTGSGARVRLRLAEGSAVKLGEDATLVIDRAESGDAFRAALRVLMGAFRFTTDPIAPGRAREIEIQAKNVSVGVRGTDLWGKSAGDRDFVVLLEGRIRVASPGHPEMILDRPFDLYEKPAGAAPSVRRADPAQVGLWAAETEISAEGAAASGAGAWRTVASDDLSPSAASALQGRLRQSGYPAEIVMAAGRIEVHVAGLDSETGARAVARRIAVIPGAATPTVRRR